MMGRSLAALAIKDDGVCAAEINLCNIGCVLRIAAYRVAGLAKGRIQTYYPRCLGLSSLPRRYGYRGTLLSCFRATLRKRLVRAASKTPPHLELSKSSPSKFKRI